MQTKKLKVKDFINSLEYFSNAKEIEYITLIDDEKSYVIVYTQKILNSDIKYIEQTSNNYFEIHI